MDGDAPRCTTLPLLMFVFIERPEADKLTFGRLARTIFQVCTPPVPPIAEVDIVVMVRRFASEPPMPSAPAATGNEVIG